MVQLCAAALSNGYIKGFAEGRIFTGPSKSVCVPGLNCYSCPGALGSCPIGALQATLGSAEYKMAFYVFGFLMIIGAFFGRLVCGWLCPFGLVQDLLYKIPFVKKIKRVPGDKWLRKTKYVILALFVILLPMFITDFIGQGKPWFCEYICPQGTLEAGIPLILLNKGLRAALGWLYVWKLFILAVIIVLSLMIYRPFCRYLCPLGAVYGFFNPAALYRFTVDIDKCIRCGICENTCKLDIKVYEKPNSFECIRCGDCKKACPQGAITNISVCRSKSKVKTNDGRI
ncbi:MAG: 4Fe-4S binding protein [Eubacteriaceae bacterium]|nr:4Fe-4S binding protein [Eubacteriaceae bacterium]